MNKNYLGTKMKYLYNKETMKFLIFPDFINHSDMNTIRATSAGFLHFFQYENSMSPQQLGVECYGESVSLKLKSDSEDSEKLTFSMRMR